MIVDVHSHIFPTYICDRRSDFFDGETAFKLLYDTPKAKMADLESLIESMDQHKVDISVTFGFPWKDPDTCRMHNDYILDAMAKYPLRVRGLCCVDIYDKGAVDEVQRCLDGGMAGVGEIAFYQSGISKNELEMLKPIMDICRIKDAPLLIHTNEPIGHYYHGKTPISLSQIYSVAEKFPDNKIVFAHWGGGIFFYFLLKKEVSAVLKNVFFDTAASPFLYDSKIYRMAIDTAGLNKILLGTDYPLINPDRYYLEMTSAGLKNDEKELICGGNAMKLFKL